LAKVEKGTAIPTVVTSPPARTAHAASRRTRPPTIAADVVLEAQNPLEAITMPDERIGIRTICGWRRWFKLLKT